MIAGFRGPQGPSLLPIAWPIALILLLNLAGCVKVRPVVLAPKTQLENQVLGSFQRLEQELILASSVRGDRPEPAISPLQREALEAMMTREFYRDDIDALKQQQVVGEANTGLLVLLKKIDDPQQMARAERLVQQENECRQVIIKRVIQISPDLSKSDLPLVHRIFYRLNLQTAQAGDRVQRPAGDWDLVQRKEPEQKAVKLPVPATNPGGTR